MHYSITHLAPAPWLHSAPRVTFPFSFFPLLTAGTELTAALPCGSAPQGLGWLQAGDWIQLCVQSLCYSWTLTPGPHGGLGIIPQCPPPADSRPKRSPLAVTLLHVIDAFTFVFERGILLHIPGTSRMCKYKHIQAALCICGLSICTVTHQGSKIFRKKKE